MLARQQRVRLPERQGFQMHELRFTPRDYLDRTKFEVGDVRPELILQNAHDGTRAYRIDAGLYRLVCRNGLVVADAHFAHVAIRHFDVSAEKFAAAAQSVADGTPRVLNTIARWQTVSLTPAARLDFVARALALRWTAEQPVTRLLNPEQLLAPLRSGDNGTDLWRTYNVLQEHLTRGGTRYAGRIPAAPDAVFPTRYLANTTRPVTGLMQGRFVNKALWQLAEQFAQN